MLASVTRTFPLKLIITKLEKEAILSGTKPVRLFFGRCKIFNNDSWQMSDIAPVKELPLIGRTYSCGNMTNVGGIFPVILLFPR